jgi:DNA-binding PadR family transcriptional regulator
MPEQAHPIHPRSPEYALLGFLYEKTAHGYSLHQQLVTELGHVWHVSQSQTYAILKRMEEQGFISATRLAQEKLPARQLLQLSPSGRLRFEGWLQTPSSSSVRAIRLDFITRLYFAQKLFPETLQGIFSAQINGIDAALERFKTSQAGIPPEQTFNRLAMELRLRQLQSIHEWLLECQKAFVK